MTPEFDSWYRNMITVNVDTFISVFVDGTDAAFDLAEYAHNLNLHAHDLPLSAKLDFIEQNMLDKWNAWIDIEYKTATEEWHNDDMRSV